jgi:hypothetical protein
VYSTNTSALIIIGVNATMAFKIKGLSRRDGKMSLTLEFNGQSLAPNQVSDITYTIRRRDDTVFSTGSVTKGDHVFSVPTFEDSERLDSQDTYTLFITADIGGNEYTATQPLGAR